MWKFLFILNPYNYCSHLKNGKSDNKMSWKKLYVSGCVLWKGLFYKEQVA